MKKTVVIVGAGLEQIRAYKVAKHLGYFSIATDIDKNALEVAANKGWDEAAKHMMDQAGGDYATMRSMYG